MKKALVIGLLAMVAICWTGCRETPECKYHTQSLNLTVLQKDWKFDKNAMQYYYSFDVPELTAFVYNYGNWTICREFNYGTKDAYQVALPMSSFMTDTLTDGSVAYYTQHIDYRVGVGYVDIQLTNSDYWYSTENPEDMLFRLQLIY